MKVIACVHVLSVSFAAHRRRVRAGLLGQGKKKKTATLFNCLPATGQENRERLTYLRNVSWVMTNHSKYQDTRSSHKITNSLTFLLAV